MASKVVHLSDKAHARAKLYCQERGLRMSDWVEALIEEAMAKDQVKSTAVAPVAKKKIVDRLTAVAAPRQEEQAPVYAGPPFWSRATGR